MKNSVWVLASLVFLHSMTAVAVPNLTASGGSTSYHPGDLAPVVVDGSLTLTDGAGQPIDGVKISISTNFVVGEDQLAFVNAGGVTGSYNATSGVLTLSGPDTPAHFEAALRTVTYQNLKSGNRTLGVRQVTFSIGATRLYFPDNHHYYEFITAPDITWTHARAAAALRTYYGLQGYLVTVTSAAENDFITSKLSGNGWMGANTPDFTIPRTWSWVTGPENGTAFFIQTTCDAFHICGTTNQGMYSNWETREPNNSAGIENCAHFKTSGQWNDYPDDATLDFGSIAGYVTEYGGMLGDPTPQLSGSKNVQVTACEANCSTCSDANTCTTCNFGFTVVGGDCQVTAASIPTLTEWGTIFFSMLMGSAAFVALRKRNAASPS